MAAKDDADNDLMKMGDTECFEQIYDDDVYDYETTNDTVTPPIRIINGKALTKDDIEKGFEFEYDESRHSKEHNEIDNNFWSKEMILKSIEENPVPDDDIPVDDKTSFDERIKAMDVVIENGVYKRMIKAGTGAVINENNAVMYHLNGFLEGLDEPFDSTWLRAKPYLHRLNVDVLLPGISLSLRTMRVGERSEFIVRPQYAYLDIGCPPRIPEKSTILYIIQVMRVFEEGTLAHYETLTHEEKDSVSFEQIFQFCNTERISGNTYFKAERYFDAAVRYRRAIRCLEQRPIAENDEKRTKELLLKLYGNIANAYVKIQRPINAMANCKKALQIDPKSVKAYYHYGTAKMLNGDYDRAKELLLKAKKLDPESRSIATALIKLEGRIRTANLQETDLYTKMGKVLTMN